MSFIINPYQFAAPAAGYNDRAQYWFDFLLSQEGITHPAKTEWNDYTDELIANGTIHATDTSGASDLIQALYDFTLGSAAATKYNTLRPAATDASFRLAYSGGWTYASTGATPNGTNGYANTFWNPNTQASLGGLTFATYIRTNSTTGTQVYGCFNGAGDIVQNNITGKNFVLGNINILSYTASTTTKLFLATRRTATDAEGYQDGTSNSTNSTNTTALPSDNFWYGARNNGSDVGEFWSSHEISIGMLSNVEMSDAEAAAFTTAVNNYATARGFNV